MSYPEKPTCHESSSIFKIEGVSWREPKAKEDGSNWNHAIHHCRTCSYCGSVHPEDLIKLIEGGATLGGADWKYGWPHKFYIENAVDAEGKVFTGKWYNAHLTDEGFDEEVLQKLLGLLSEHSGITWLKDEKGIGFKAPYPGYQRGANS